MLRFVTAALGPTHSQPFVILSPAYACTQLSVCADEMGFTCIMVVCSLIQWWREEASSLNCSNFFCASASKRGWPGGGSGMKIWILRNVGDSFTWEHVIQLGDIRNDRLLVRFGGIDI